MWGSFFWRAALAHTLAWIAPAPRRSWDISLRPPGRGSRKPKSARVRKRRVRNRMARETRRRQRAMRGMNLLQRRRWYDFHFSW